MQFLWLCIFNSFLGIIRYFDDFGKFTHLHIFFCFLIKKMCLLSKSWNHFIHYIKTYLVLISTILPTTSWWSGWLKFGCVNQWSWLSFSLPWVITAQDSSWNSTSLTLLSGITDLRCFLFFKYLWDKLFYWLLRNK